MSYVVLMTNLLTFVKSITKNWLFHMENIKFADSSWSRTKTSTAFFLTALNISLQVDIYQQP